MISRLRRITLLLPFAVVAAFEIFFRKPELVWWLFALLPVLVFAAVSQLLGPGLKTPSARFNFLITPVLLIWSALGFSLLLELEGLRHVLAAAVGIFLILFFESLALYIWKHDTYETFSLENLSGYANTLAAFLTASTLLGFSVLLTVQDWIILVVFGGTIFLLSYELLWISKLTFRQTRTALLVITLLSFEIFGALQTLPLHFMTAGAVFTVLWYTALVITRAAMLQVLKPAMVKRHLALAFALLLVLLSTARWV